MTSRPPVALLLLSTSAIVAAISWWLSSSPVLAGAPQVPEPRGHVDTHDSAVPFERRQRSGDPEPLMPLEDDDGLGEDELWAQISDPTNSDLPGELFDELTRLGTDVVRADATGRGRERWPEYWNEAPSGRSDPCCDHVVIHGAGAFTDPANHNMVRVAVLWGGHPADGKLMETRGQPVSAKFCSSAIGAVGGR